MRDEIAQDFLEQAQILEHFFRENTGFIERCKKIGSDLIIEYRQRSDSELAYIQDSYNHVSKESPQTTRMSVEGLP